jgi:hypothetical protein
MTAIDVLKKARDILEPEGAWTKGEYARGVNHERVSIKNKDAVCFCASGAIYRATIAIFNDDPETTQLHVLMAFDFAILAAMDEE